MNYLTARELQNIEDVNDGAPGQVASPSEPAPSETAGPLPVVGSGGVVGLRVESAEVLCLQWHARSVQLKADAAAVRNAACWPLAAKANAEAATYDKCIEELRRLMEAATVRQPEPNGRDEPRRSEA